MALSACTGIRLGSRSFSTGDEHRFAVGQIAEIVETGASVRHRAAATH